MRCLSQFAPHLVRKTINVDVLPLIVFEACLLIVQNRRWFEEWHFIISNRVRHFTKMDVETELTFSGERDIPWSIKQAIKNELFGEDRLAIEVFPTEKALVDIMDCYHLWVFPKGFKLPFGIHPTKDTQCRPIARGCLPFTDKLEQNSLRFSRLEK